MTTRSRALVRAPLAGVKATVTLYTVQPGDIVIVKSLLLIGATASATPLSIYVDHPGFAAVYLYYKNLDSLVPEHFDFWVVLEEGDQIVADSPVPGVSVWISGAVLPAPGSVF